MSWLNEILQGMVLHYSGRVYSDRLENEPQEFDIDEAGEAVKEKLLDLIEQARNKSLPLGFLTDEIKKL